MTTYATSIYNYVGRRLSWSSTGANSEQPQRPTSHDLLEGPSGTSLHPVQAFHQAPQTLQLPLSSAVNQADSDLDDTISEQTVVAVENDPPALRPPPTSDAGDAAYNGDLAATGRTDNSLTNAISGFDPPTMSPPEGSSQAQTSNSRLNMEQRPNTASDDDSLKPVALPEDDGQKALRQLLVEIHKMDISEREKAKKMHAVMTEKYNASKEKKKMSQQVYPSQKENPFEVTEEDARPTYHKGSELGCSHYKRGVKLQCSTCHRWHTCRFCHDEAEDHILIRRETKNMLCMHCGKAQPAQQDCRYCGVKSARYYCDKCKLWDDDPEKKIYHCDDCGICRIGAGLGKDFFHCKKCGVCMSIRLQEHHRCIERSTECDCPICGEFMFTSTLTVVFMKCGHSIHHVCYYEHMKSSYRCPTCYRTIINMESQFRALDNEIAHQPLPPPYDSWRCLISCNDCSARSNVPFHFLGLKCDTCRSYNTSQVRLIRPEDSTSGLSPPGSGEHDHMTPTALPPDRAPLLSNPTPSSSNGDSTGTSTLMAATAVIASADDAINMVSETGLIYDDGWDSSEEDEEDTDSWSHCESDHESAPDEQALFTDIDETILEDDDEDEEDDFLALTGHR